MEVTVKPYPRRKKRTKFNPRAVFYPLAACAAALLIVFAGLNRLGGGHVDHQHPVQPLSSGLPAATHTNTPGPTSEPTAYPMPTPQPVVNTPEPAKEVVAPTPQPTPQPKAKICGECGETGHDDDHCPNEICDECGEKGHDDDDCPYQRCDECGRIGHDDDSCPEQICDECGETGHDDDHCPKKHHSGRDH